MLHKITLSVASALVLLGALPSPVSSASLAPIAVSLVVQETCEIRSGTGRLAPSVSCLHGGPFGVALAPLDPTQPLSTPSSSINSAEPTVWAVAF
jgi:hypothetical protein